MSSFIPSGEPDSGSYTMSQDGEFAITSPFAVTVQLCFEPDGVMEQERAHIEALLAATAYRTAWSFSMKPAT